MARGESGRVVIEVDPALKHDLYVALAASGSTLKDWFVKEAKRHCAAVAQPALFKEPEEQELAKTPDIQSPKLSERSATPQEISRSVSEDQSR